jgi:hypothetical protein
MVLPSDDVPGNMTFGPTWSNLRENVDVLQSTATLITPLLRKTLAIEDVQKHRVLIQYRDDDEAIPLQKEQFETLYERVSDSHGGLQSLTISRL